MGYYVKPVGVVTLSLFYNKFQRAKYLDCAGMKQDEDENKQEKSTLI